MTTNRDILIVGGGLAGLFLALKLAPRRCTVIALAPLGQAAASAWAQGGLAAALSPEDEPSLHASDTLAAGAGIVDPVVARLIAEDGPARVRDLERELRIMGPINPLALEEFNALQERHAFLETQLEDVRDPGAQVALLTRIGEINEERLRDVDRAFGAYARAVTADPALHTRDLGGRATTVQVTDAVCRHLAR